MPQLDVSRVAGSPPYNTRKRYLNAYAYHREHTWAAGEKDRFYFVL